MSHPTKDLRKAAILLVSVSDETASEILKHLDSKTASLISEEIRVLGEIKQEERNQAVGDFLKELLDEKIREGAGVIRRWCNSYSFPHFPRFSIDKQ